MSARMSDGDLIAAMSAGILNLEMRAAALESVLRDGLDGGIYNDDPDWWRRCFDVLDDDKWRTKYQDPNATP